MEHFNLTKKLHTDVLEEKYGPVHSEVVRHDDEVREAHLIDAQGISRTYAITFFTFDRSNEELCTIDDEIRQGGLIGKVFRDHGYEIRKNVIEVFLIDLPDAIKSKMKTDSAQAKVRLAEFYAKKLGETPIIYGVVSEIYSPDFRPAEINEVDKQQENPTTIALDAAGISKEEIWERLGRNNDFSDLADKVETARVEGASITATLVQQVENYVSRK